MWCILVTTIITQLLTNIWMFYAKVRWSDMVQRMALGLTPFCVLLHV